MSGLTGLDVRGDPPRLYRALSGLLFVFGVLTLSPLAPLRRSPDISEDDEEDEEEDEEEEEEEGEYRRGCCVVS